MAIPPPALAPPPPPPPTEVSLLADAYRALASHTPSAALSTLDADALAHPTGSLAEERDALRVTALLDLARSTDAAAAASRFLALYPHSIHRAAVSRALTTQESP